VSSRAAALAEPWPAAAPRAGTGWRGSRADCTAPAFAAWCAEHWPAPVRAALLAPETRTRAEIAEGGLLVALRGINFNRGQESADIVWLRLWATERLVVTARLRRIFAVEETRARVTSGTAPRGPGAFPAQPAGMLTEKTEAVTAACEEATDEVEEVLLDDRPGRIGTGERQIGQLARSIIKLRRHVAPLREALTRLAGLEAAILGPAERRELKEVANRLLRLIEELDSTRDRRAILRAHVDSLHAARIGRHGFVLPVVAAIFLPLGFLTGLFGVNVAGMPGADWPGAFAALAGGGAGRAEPVEALPATADRWPIPRLGADLLRAAACRDGFAPAAAERLDGCFAAAARAAAE
jgi:zinc transporter